MVLTYGTTILYAGCCWPTCRYAAHDHTNEWKSCHAQVAVCSHAGCGDRACVFLCRLALGPAPAISGTEPADKHQLRCWFHRLGFLLCSWKLLGPPQLTSRQRFFLSCRSTPTRIGKSEGRWPQRTFSTHLKGNEKLTHWLWMASLCHSAHCPSPSHIPKPGSRATCLFLTTPGTLLPASVRAAPSSRTHTGPFHPPFSASSSRKPSLIDLSCTKWKNCYFFIEKLYRCTSKALSSS